MCLKPGEFGGAWREERLRKPGSDKLDSNDSAFHLECSRFLSGVLTCADVFSKDHSDVVCRMLCGRARVDVERRTWLEK